MSYINELILSLANISNIFIVMQNRFLKGKRKQFYVFVQCLDFFLLNIN